MVFAYNVDSAISTGLYITVTAFDVGYHQTDAFAVAIIDGGPTPPDGTGQNTGIMTLAVAFGPTASLFFRGMIWLVILPLL